MINTRKIAYTGLIMALITVATTIHLPMPIVSGGYVHLGDFMIILAAVFLGWKYGAVAAGIGSMLADIIAGYAQWAPFTLVIKAVMAILVGIAVTLNKKRAKVIYSALVMIMWSAFMLVMKFILNNGIDTMSDRLVDEMEGVSSMSELLSLNNSVQAILLISSLVVIVVSVGVGIYTHKSNKRADFSLIIGSIAAGLWMIIGYYFTEYLLYGSYIVPVISIPFNIGQFTTGMVIAFIVHIPLKKIVKPL